MEILKYESENELYHHGIKGQKWGVRRFQNANGSYTAAGKKRRRAYMPTSLASAKARYQNRKVDKSFEQWNVNKARKEKAIASGKARNQALMDYKQDPHNRDLKRTYKQANREYKSDLRKNTAYRKGAIRGEVGHDEARKHLSRAKAIEKRLKVEPDNRELQKQYRYHMNKHDVARAKARKAPTVGANRSRRIANLRAMRTKAVKGALVSEAAILGAYEVNKYMTKNGKPGFQVSPEQMKKWASYGKAFMGMSNNFY